MAKRSSGQLLVQELLLDVTLSSVALGIALWPLDSFLIDIEEPSVLKELVLTFQIHPEEICDCSTSSGGGVN